jgi:hypothetical protein
MRRALALLAVAVTVVATLASVAASAPWQSGLTMKVERFFEQEFGVWRLRFTGAIPSGAANEYVAIMHQKCGYRFSTAIGGATTQEGGVYAAIPRFGIPPQSGTFRAQWKGRVSDPVTLRSPVQLRVSKLRGRGRYRASITAESNLRGRHVALQRLVGGQWTHVRRMRLVSGGQAGFTGYFDATFTVRKRGLRLRVFVPAKTVGSCHDPTASATFVS